MREGPLRIGLIGFGTHARKVVIPAMLESPATQLVAVSSRVAYKEAARSGLPVDVFSDYSLMCQRADIEAVYVATSNEFHHEATQIALHNNLHVICEKPLALSLEHALSTQKLAQDKSLVAVENFAYRFHPQHRKVCEIVDSGEIGQPRYIRAQFGYNLHAEGCRDFGSRLSPVGGGGLNDAGCYLVDIGRFLLREEPIVVGAYWNVDPILGVDDFASFQLVFPSGVVLMATCGTGIFRQNSYEVVGDVGMLSVPCAFKIPRNKHGEVLMTSSLIKEQKRSTRSQVIKTEPCNQVVEGLKRFALQVKRSIIGQDTFRQGTAPDDLYSELHTGRNVLENGTMNARIMDEIRRKARCPDATQNMQDLK